MNGQPIVMSADLPHLVGGLKPGTKIDLGIVRDGNRKNLSLSIGALPEDGEELAGAGESSGAERSSNRLGVLVAGLSEEQQKALDIKGGVVIREIQDGPAALMGLRPGDVITHLNNQAIDSVQTFAKIARNCRRTVRCPCVCCVRVARASSPSNCRSDPMH